MLKYDQTTSGVKCVMGKGAVGTSNYNGERLIMMCSMNDLVIGGSIFQHKDVHKTT